MLSRLLIDWIKCLLLLINVIYGKYSVDDHIFYFSSHQYQLANLSHFIFIDKEDKKIPIKITLHSDSFLSINNELIISNYDDDKEFLEIQLHSSVNNGAKGRRRLRTCHWNHCWWHQLS